MICIVVALKKEAESFILDNNLKKISDIIGKSLYCGKVNGKETVLAISGIGKVNAAVTTQVLIDKYNPDFIINFGSAGGINGCVKVKNYYLIDSSAQYDFDLSKLDDVPIGYIQDFNRVLFPNYTTNIDFLEKRNLATADKFSDSEEDRKIIASIPASICDMEGGAISETCLINNIPLICVKGITDVNDSGLGAEQFNENLKSVSSGFTEIINKIINLL